MDTVAANDQWTPHAHRGIVVAARGIVAASQPLAVSAGLDVLRAGGSFIDAAIATSAVLVVTEPYNSHLGGDAFAIVWDQAERSATAYNGSGRAPSVIPDGAYANGIPVHGPQAVTVPGLVDCWFTLHARYGRLPIARVLEAALDYARDGFPAGFRYAQVFAQHAASGADWFAPALMALTGRSSPPRPGDVIRQRDLAWTLECIVAGGRDAFYAGPVAERMLAHLRANGGFHEGSDFASHRTVVTKPLTADYRGLTIHAQPPVSQGAILVEMLNILEGFDLSDWGFGDTRTVHAMVEAKKAAFADRYEMLGDPDFVTNRVADMISKDIARTRRQTIHQPGAGREPGRDTTYFCVADSDGNAVSFIQSVYHSFGSGCVAEGTGVLFNNRMTGFSLDPGSPNRLAPDKRPIHTLNTYIATEGDRLRYVGGTPGGDVQVQSNAQVLVSLVDFEMNVQQAVEAPRWQHVPDPSGPGMAVLIESRFPRRLADDLSGLGHVVRWIGPWNHSSAYQLIEVTHGGAYMGASDPRCDGHAAGF